MDVGCEAFESKSLPLVGCLHQGILDDEFCSRQISQEMMAVGRGQIVKLNVTYIGAEERRSWIE